MTEMVCWATGGPQKYTGRAMRVSHGHLKITRVSGALFARISMTPWPNSMCPRPSTRNYLASCRAPRVTLSPVEGKAGGEYSAQSAVSAEAALQSFVQLRQCRTLHQVSARMSAVPQPTWLGSPYGQTTIRHNHGYLTEGRHSAARQAFHPAAPTPSTRC